MVGFGCIAVRALHANFPKMLVENHVFMYVCETISPNLGTYRPISSPIISILIKCNPARAQRARAGPQRVTCTVIVLGKPQFSCLAHTRSAQRPGHPYVIGIRGPNMPGIVRAARARAVVPV